MNAGVHQVDFKTQILDFSPCFAIFVVPNAWKMGAEKHLIATLSFDRVLALGTIEDFSFWMVIITTYFVVIYIEKLYVIYEMVNKINNLHD